MGYSPWGHKEPDVTERLTFFFIFDMYYHILNGMTGHLATFI